MKLQRMLNVMLHRMAGEEGEIQQEHANASRDTREVEDVKFRVRRD